MTSLDSSSPNNGTLPHSAQFLYLLDFINSSRAGSAQKEYGISFRTFITSLMLTLIYCAAQTSLFSLIRGRMISIYQPNCFHVPKDERVQQLDNNLFSWLVYSILTPLEEYKKMGLDAYFFLRFISFLLTMFLGLAIINIPTLIPVNYLSGYDKYTESDLTNFTNGTITVVKGLDKISMSNISPKFSKRMSIHLTMTVITIFWFHGLIIYELLNYVKIKNTWLMNNSDFLNSKLPERDRSNTILVDNVPVKLLNKKQLSNLFTGICGAKVKNIWIVYNYRGLKLLYNNHLKLASKIESLETGLIMKKLQEKVKSDQKITVTSKAKTNFLKHKARDFLNYKLRMKYYVIPTFSYYKIEEQLVPLTTEYVHNYQLLQNRRKRLVLREASPMNDHKLNKVFIQFEDSLQPDILNQIQISHKINHLDKTIIRVNPKDVIWENLTIESNMEVFMRLLMGNLLGSLLIMLWVIPVSFVTLISQVPYLSRLIPGLGWMRQLPQYATDVISNLFSVIFLLCLMELVPCAMRLISFLKCKRTGAEIELDVQKWMFAFSFIHVFMVVAITSEFTVIIESLLHNPVSIPDILANNLPKCANFFFSYMMIRGIAYFGNNLLQNYRLFMNLFVYRFIDVTPRQKFERLSNIPVYKWGSLYSSFALLASIGLIYSILSPLILVFILIAFSMALISFKYSIMFQFSHKNYSETYGQFYPTAIFHLYAGIYFLEICLIGLFASSKDEFNQPNCLHHALFTLVMLILTTTGQVQLKKKFGKLLGKNLPVELYDSCIRRSQSEKNKEHIISSDLRPFFNDSFYEGCFQHNSTMIWLPKDSFHISDGEVQSLNSLGIDASNEYCNIDNDGGIEVLSCPPDHID